MYSRHLLAATIVCLGLAVSLCPTAHAQDGPDNGPHPTAAELYERGMEAYEAGEYDRARELLERLDAMQLPRAQRARRSETLERIDEYLVAAADEPDEPEEPEAPEEPEEPGEPEVLQEPAEPEAPTAADVMARADAAFRENDLEEAASLYRQVARDSDADAELRSHASARLSVVRRRIDRQVTDARSTLDAASRDVDAGRYDRAEERLEEVRASDVTLGWFDRQRLDRLGERVAVARAAAEAEAAPEPEPEPEPVTVADADVDAEPADEPAEAEVPEVPEEEEEEVTEPTEPEVVVEDEVDPAEAEDAAVEVADSPREMNDILAEFRREQAAHRVREGREAAQAGQYRLAIRHFTAALEFGPEDPDQVRSEREAARAALAAEGAPQEPIREHQERLQVFIEQAIAMFEDHMGQAQRHRQRGEFTQALDAVERARTVLDQNRTLLGEARYERLHRQAEQLSGALVAERREAEAARVEQVERDAQLEAQRRRQELRRQREREVQGLLQRAWALRQDMEYEHALELVDQALGLDPTNLTAQVMQQSIEDAKVLVDQRREHRRRAEAISVQHAHNLEASIPYPDLIRYPADWPQLSERRIRDLDDPARESEEDAATREALRTRIPVEFDATPLVSVIDFLQDTTGANFWVNWAALELAGIDQDEPITMRMENIPAERVLNLVLRDAGGAAEFDPIGYSIVEGVVHISTERDLEQDTDTRVYDIRDLLVQVPNFDDPPEMGLGGGGGGGGDLDFGDAGRDDADAAREEMIEEITEIIRESVGRFDEWVEMGGDVSSLREFNGNLIVSTTARNHLQLANLLDQLRATRAIQINVEARFLLVDQNFLERIGVDMDAAIPDPGGNFEPIRVAQDHISLGAPSPSFLSPFGEAGGQGIAPVQPGQQVSGLFPGSGRAFDLTAAYMSDLEVSLVVTATQRHKQAISLTAPRVTFFNGQRAWVVVAREISYISDLSLVPDTVGFEPDMDFINVGVVLDVEGVVSADRRYVTLTLVPGLATLGDLRQIPFRAADTFPDPDDPDGEDQLIVVEGLLELPEVEVTRVAATVSIPDRGTLLLGGQRLVQDVEQEAGVPVLSKLPFINRLFTNRGVSKDERTLLILVKPRIIIQQEEEDLEFPGLREELDMIGRGIR